MKTPPLRPVTMPPLGPSRLRVEHHPRRARLGLDHSDGLRAPISSSPVNSADQRARRAAELPEGGEDEHVHHQPAFMSATPGP
jgi:hypothetical protein